MNESQFIDFLLDLPNQPEGEIIEAKPIDLKAERKHAILARLDEALKPYGWTTDFTSIFNRKGAAVHTLKIKGSRVQLSDGDTIRASLAQPENIGQYIEKTFYAVKVNGTPSLKSTLEAALDGKATRQDVIAAIDAELAADPEPYSMVEGEGAGQYTFDTPKDSQLAMF